MLAVSIECRGGDKNVQNCLTSFMDDPLSKNPPYLLDITFSIDLPLRQVERSRADVDVLVELGQFPDVSFQMFPLVTVETDANLNSKKE